MTIPDRPLHVTLDVNDMTLDEACLFTTGGFDLAAFRAFMLAHTDWTREEIGALKVRELEAVAKQLSAALQAAAVPLAKAPRSRRGRG